MQHAQTWQIEELAELANLPESAVQHPSGVMVDMEHEYKIGTQAWYLQSRFRDEPALYAAAMADKELRMDVYSIAAKAGSLGFSLQKSATLGQQNKNAKSEQGKYAELWRDLDEKLEDETQRRILELCEEQFFYNFSCCHAATVTFAVIHFCHRSRSRSGCCSCCNRYRSIHCTHYQLLHRH